MVLNGLADLPVTVIAATADRSDLDNIPANAYVADYPPGEAAAARSDVVICNGGSLTTQQALVAGVPVLGIASNLDQHLNMQAIEAAGAGLLLRTERLKARSVSAAVRQLLDRPGYRQSAQELARCSDANWLAFLSMWRALCGAYPRARSRNRRPASRGSACQSGQLVGLDQRSAHRRHRTIRSPQILDSNVSSMPHCG